MTVRLWVYNKNYQPAPFDVFVECRAPNMGMVLAHPSNFSIVVRCNSTKQQEFYQKILTLIHSARAYGPGKFVTIPLLAKLLRRVESMLTRDRAFYWPTIAAIEVKLAV